MKMKKIEPTGGGGGGVGGIGASKILLYRSTSSGTWIKFLNELHFVKAQWCLKWLRLCLRLSVISRMAFRSILEKDKYLQYLRVLLNYHLAKLQTLTEW